MTTEVEGQIECPNSTKPLVSGWRILEYERPEFMQLVNAVISLKGDEEEVYYRQPFRWFNDRHELQSNCYEMFSMEGIAEFKNKKIVRTYGEHIFVAACH